MFFVLSKTLNYLTMPFVLVCLCLLASALIKKQKWKKRLFWTGMGLLLFFSNEFIANEMMLLWEPRATPFKEIKQPYELGIILTGVTELNRKPDDRVYFKIGADRVYHTLHLYRLGLVKKILVSGGTGRLIDSGQRESEDIRDALIVMGVDSLDIMVESDSKNTRQSAVEVKKILDAENIRYEDCLLITSAFHIPRSIACFRKVGMDMDTFATDFYTHPREFTPDVLIIPKVESFFVWHKLIREWVGFIAYKIAGYV